LITYKPNIPLQGKRAIKTYNFMPVIDRGIGHGARLGLICISPSSNANLLEPTSYWEKNVQKFSNIIYIFKNLIFSNVYKFSNRQLIT